MDRIINVKVGGNHLSKDSKNAGVRGEANVTSLRITFDEGWNGYTKKITFWNARGLNPVVITLLPHQAEDETTYIVPIPAEPMEEAGMLTFVIEGTVDDKVQKSFSDKLEVKDAPIADNAGQPVPPTEDELTQLAGEIEKIKGDVLATIEAKEETEQYAKDAQGYSNTAQEHSGIAQGYKDNAKIYSEHAETAAERAEKAVVHEPIIIDGYWHIWNATSEKYIDTGVKAQAGSTVYLGENPPKDADVWIDPDGDGGIDLSKVESTTNKVKHIDFINYGDEQYPNANAVVEAIMQNGVNVESYAIAHAEAYTDYKVGELTEQTEIIKSDVDGLQAQINEEAHFRGYLSTNAKIQALKATPNDFAYSAESGTKWVYDIEGGWVDTGTPVPDQLTPASTTTPLINGVASVGSENAYARGDHRHPTDTTRASAEEVKQLKANKVTEINAESTDEEYPSAKAAYEGIQAKTSWELVKSDTLTSDVTNIELNLPTDYKELFWRFTVPTQNAEKESSFSKARTYLYVNDGVVVADDQSYNMKDDGYSWFLSYHIQNIGHYCSVFKGFHARAERIDSTAYIWYTAPNVNWQPGKYIGEYGLSKVKILMYSEVKGVRVFPVGTTYELWGVRA